VREGNTARLQKLNTKPNHTAATADCASQGGAASVVRRVQCSRVRRRLLGERDTEGTGRARRLRPLAVRNAAIAQQQVVVHATPRHRTRSAPAVRTGPRGRAKGARRSQMPFALPPVPRPTAERGSRRAQPAEARHGDRPPPAAVARRSCSADIPPSARNRRHRASRCNAALRVALRRGLTFSPSCPAAAC